MTKEFEIKGEEGDDLGSGIKDSLLRGRGRDSFIIQCCVSGQHRYMRGAPFIKNQEPRAFATYSKKTPNSSFFLKFNF